MTKMRAVRVVGYHQNLELHEVDKPEPAGPFDVIVRIGGAGVCRTDLHILEGQWAENSNVELPYTIGHENAGWVEALGPGATGFEVGEAVAVYGPLGCGSCARCQVGDENLCDRLAELPGVSLSRTHQIVPGALVAEACMDIFDLAELEICPWALREGVILERIDKLGVADED